MSQAAEDNDDLTALEGTELVGRYRLDRLLGRGGMGAVYSGEQLTLGRKVAIKLLHPELSRDDQIRKRFEREAKSTAKLEHPNIVQVLEFGTTDEGMMFIVMQLLEGGELDERLGAPMDVRLATYFVIQIMRALEHAHKQGVVHRDLKPENVFVVADDDGNEIAKLVDFGIAKIVEGGDDGGDKMTKAGLVFGTPAYMSPEQATGMETDARTDLYSAGIIFYALLSGEPPFDADDPVSLIRMQVSTDPPPLPANVPASVQRIVSTLLAKNRDERFQSATEARAALETCYTNLELEISASTAANLQLPASPSAAIYLDASEHAGHPPTGAHRAVSMNQLQAVPHEATPVHGTPLGPTGTVPEGIRVGSGPVAAADQASTKTLLYAAVGLAAVALIAAVGFGLAATRGDGPNQGGDTAGPAATADAGEGKADPNAIPKSLADPAKLAEIERALSAKKSGEALALIQPLRDEFPEDPILLWKAGKALASRNPTRIVSGPLSATVTPTSSPRPW